MAICGSPRARPIRTPSSDSVAIGRITAVGDIQTFTLPRRVHPNGGAMGNITLGPDGNLWFPISYDGKSEDAQGTPNTIGAIGRLTAKGDLKVHSVLSMSYDSYSDASPPSGIISGPDGKLWCQEKVHGTTGIARISTSGKIEPLIPPPASSRTWFACRTVRFGLRRVPPGLGVATRSGIVVTQDLPGLSPGNDLSPGYGNWTTMTTGPDGNLWLTSGKSAIQQISGLRQRLGQSGLPAPLQASTGLRLRPIYLRRPMDQRHENVRPTFAGVATPGAEVTLWAQKQGDNQPISIGQVQASQSDGSWTLKSQVKLTSGNYAVTATQTGDTGPPSVLYSLTPDSSGNLSNALVIQTRHPGK